MPGSWLRITWSTAVIAFLVPCAGGDGLPSLVSPGGGSVVQDLRIPLSVHIPREWHDRTVAVSLDGDDITDPVGIVRKRWSRGGGADYLARLDLSGEDEGEKQLVVTFTAEDGSSDLVVSRFSYRPHPHRVHVTLQDGQGRPRPGKVLVFDELLGPFHLWGDGSVEADPSGRDDEVHFAFAPEGEVSIALPPGRYRLVGTSGLRDGIDLEDITVTRDLDVTLELPRQVDTPGWLAADLHVHTGVSTDAFVADRDRFEALATSGLDVAVISDHNRVRDARPALELLGLDEDLAVVPGAEARIGRKPKGDEEKAQPGSSRGHVNAFPLVAGPPLPDKNPDSLVAVLKAWRDRQQQAPYPGVGDRVLLQLNHPRGIQFFPDHRLKDAHALLNDLHYRPARPIDEQPAAWLRDPTQAWDFDTIELVNRFSLSGYRLVREDWFSLMNQGHFITATGNSDSHSVNVELVGMTVNLVHAPPPRAGAPLDLASFVGALAAGEAMVTTGPFVELSVTGGEGLTVGPGGQVTAPEGRVRVTVRVRAATWVPVEEVRLVVDGEVVASVVPEVTDQPDRGTWTWEVEVGDDAWIIAEAGCPVDVYRTEEEGPYGAVAPGYVPLAFTNPVRVDRDGDGQWAKRYPRLVEPPPESAPVERAR